MNERKQQRKLEQYERRDREMRTTALQALLGSPDGRAFLWWLFGVTKVESSPFTQDPHATAFQCGEQNIGIQLKVALIDADPEGYVKLLQEKASERQQRQSSLDRDADDSYRRDGPDNVYDPDYPLEPDDDGA